MNNIDEFLTRGVANIVPNKDGLEKMLRSEKKLNVYAGFDVTAPKLTLGHTVPFRKLQALAELGHNVTFLIGDFTTLIGDTSDKETERKPIAPKQIKKDLETYQKQASKILDFSKIETKFNSKWLNKLTPQEIIQLCQHFSLGDFIGRELIKKRLESGKRVGLHEVLYPAIQGYDHYYLDTDLQIGATEQTFNMNAGRTLQKDLRGKESYFMTLMILEGTDGRKMSKSWGNAIWIEDKPEEMYAKIMSLGDHLIEQYFILVTSVPMEEVKEKVAKSKKEPLAIKKELAFQIVKEMHSEKDAQRAQEAFEKTFQEQKPEFKTEVSAKENLAQTISQVVGSVSEAKRLISQGAVDISGATVYDPTLKVNSGDEIKVGTQTFVKVKK
ncbi:MAG: Tyrosine-tRNA ligase [Candidatus Woesebacteria bacterium GW2011_GWB1_39_12]|uniref:Tyrosine--tRNA ligase n=2 Tax=Candidatus Woeseibacteriota TaxID=1752722 RepID=A0A0G0M6A9_9BACT|nr:MAG: Tyrosine-tRNA ligase [Candidatus Woesebacteria bacterium GW2011_GWA1_39_12]KKR01878.1 MAG: Tyrosine-tRNA ligase [Candidatus Woesebacteria bacterium GW2011_GWB1_39_12]